MAEESNDMFNAIKLELEGLSPDFTLLQQDLTEEQRQVFQQEFRVNISAALLDLLYSNCWRS